MPPTYATTTKHGLRKLTGGNLASDIDAGFAALAEDLDGKIAVDSQGSLGSRPTSTPGSPGKSGRWYKDTGSGGLLFRDYGTGWDGFATQAQTDGRYVRGPGVEYGPFSPGFVNLAAGASAYVDFYHGANYSTQPLFLHSTGAILINSWVEALDNNNARCYVINQTGNTRTFNVRVLVRSFG